MNPILECIAYAVRWDLTAIAFALCVFPFFHALFPRRIAWAGARLLSPALIAYAVILPGILHRPTPFTPELVLMVTGALGLAAWLGWGKAALESLRSSKADEGLRPILQFEKAHLLFLLLACCYVPFIDSMMGMGERLRDTGILNAVLTQRVFPVEEPWFAGVRIQYYTFGYYVPATIGFFCGRDTLFVYNLIIVWTFASYGAAGWTFFRALRLSWASSLFGAAVIALSSNLASFCQAINATVVGGNYDWWWVSRVLENTIDEFPLWTASLGDLHPHYLAMPFFPALLAWIAGIWESEETLDSAGAWRYGGVAALLIAWIWGANTWELPVCFTVAIGALWLGGRHLGWRALARVTLGTTAASVALAGIFLLTTPKANKTFGWVHQRSTALEILLYWGLFLLPILAATGHRLWKRLQSDWLIAIACALGLSFVLQSGLVLIALSLCLVARVIYEERAQPSLTFLLALAGLGLILLCELVHLNDIFGDGLERLNTVFKFYVPAWALMASAAALCALELARTMPKQWARVALGGWALLLSGHLLVGLSARTGGFSMLDSMDGYDFWSRLAPEDTGLMRWAREEVLAHRLSGTVLEATGGAYHEYGRVMTAAGLPGYFAWEGYGGMLQTLGSDPQIDHRQTTAKAIFNGTNFQNRCDLVVNTLAQEKIDWVVIGQIERREFSPAGIELLQRCLPTVHTEGGSRFLSAKITEPRDSESLARGQAH